MNVPTLQIASLLALLLAAGSVLYLRVDNNHMAAEIVRLGDDAEKDQKLIRDQSAALSAVDLLRRDVAKIGANTRALQQEIAAQSSTMSRDLEELKRNDQDVRQYLAGSVPVAVGLRWQRAESTDPGTYRHPAIVQPDAVPTSSKAGAAPQ